MNTLLKAIVLCCALAIGAMGAMPDALAGPGGKDKVEKGHRGNQGKDFDLNLGGGKNNDILDIGAGDLVRAGITLAAARQLALDGGFTGYTALPPGIAKNLARGKPLPPGIARKMAPGGMIARLPVHPGYEWRVLGSDLVLIYTATSLVADVLQGVFD